MRRGEDHLPLVSVPARVFFMKKQEEEESLPYLFSERRGPAIKNKKPHRGLTMKKNLNQLGGKNFLPEGTSDPKGLDLHQKENALRRRRIR